MDKMLVIIIIFLAVVFSLAGVLSMSAIPKIFQSAEKINQTQEIVNQTLMQQHEDSARFNQTLHEDGARANQSQLILNETNTSIIKHQKDLEMFMTKLNRDNHIILAQQNQSLKNQENMLKGMQIILDETVVKIKDNQIIVSKYGQENNALTRGIAEKLGLNISDLLEEYYIENNMTPIYPPPPPLSEESLQRIEKENTSK